MSEGVLVGGEPTALLSASSALYEIATRTDDIGRRLAEALRPAATTIAATVPFLPGPASAVSLALQEVLASPTAGLGSVGVSFFAASQCLRQGAEALEAAGAVGLMARGLIALRMSGVPEILASTDGIDIRRESISGRVSFPGVSWGGNLFLRQVKRPDGSMVYVVERTRSGATGYTYGAQVNSVGAFADISGGNETTERWVVKTQADAEKMATLILTGQMSGHPTPQPTDTTNATAGSITLVGGTAALSGTGRLETTVDRSGTQRFSAILSGVALIGLTGVAGTGKVSSVKVTVERSPAGVINKFTLTRATEIDQGRHGNPLIEAGNRAATLTEHEWEIAVTPERRAEMGRIADDLANRRQPNKADLASVEGAVRNVTPIPRVYDVRHQSISADVAIAPYEGGGGASIDTAVLRGG